MRALRLKDIREDNDYFQKDIAKLLKISQAQYSRYESGLNEIPLNNLIILAKFYNVSLDYLCCLTDIKKTYEKSKIFY